MGASLSVRRRELLRRLLGIDNLRRAVYLVVVAGGAGFTALGLLDFGKAAYAMSLMHEGSYAGTVWAPPEIQSSRYPIPVLNQSGTTPYAGVPADRAVVLTYSVACNSCSHNFARWIDLIARIDPDVPVFAVSADSIGLQENYWRGLLPRVTLLQIPRDRAAATRWVPDRVPSTLVLRHGDVRLGLVGTLDENRLNKILEVLKQP